MGSETAQRRGETELDGLAGNVLTGLAESGGDALEMGKVQLVLAEQRTSLALLRTGIAVFTLPLSVTTVLVATSKFYEFFENLHYLIPLLILSVLLVGVGAYLIVVSLVRFRRQNELIRRIALHNPRWKDLLG